MSEKRTRGAIILLSSLIYFLSFLFFFYGGYNSSAGVFFTYASAFLRDFVYFVLSAISFGCAYKLYLKGALKAALISSLLLAVPYLFYSVPLWYLNLTLAGYTPIEVLILLVPEALFSFLLSYATIVAMCLCAVFVTKKLLCGEKREASLIGELSKTGAFDTGAKINLVVLISVGLLFLYYLISELISTLSYVIDYAGEYRTGEIIYIAARYLFLLFSYFTAYLLARLVLRKNNA